MKTLVRDTIAEYNLIDERDKIVIGVSGGHDSMALLYVLLSLREELKFNIIIAHINHGVRGYESDGDEEYVRKQAKNFGLPFYSKKVNMDEYASNHKLTSEEAGREIRYDFFRCVLEIEKADKIAVAHNKNDQAETLLMRFMRGTGIDGLRGMEYKARDIIRPILGVERRVIESYCREQNIVPRIDKTNKMSIYGRNKVRLELIPFIEKTFNKGIINTLFRTSETMKTDSDFLIQYSKSSLENSIIEKEKEKIVLDVEVLTDLHSAITSRVLRLAICEVNTNLKGVEKKHIDDIVDLIECKKTGISLDIGNKIKAKVDYDRLTIKKGLSEESKDFSYRVNIGESLDLHELNSQLLSNVYSIRDVDMDFNNSLVKCFDYDNIKSEICVRNRRNGDKFIPIGMRGHKKLKDFFMDQKIPKEQRNSIPIVLDGEEIMWVVGLRISEKYKVNAETKNVLVLEYKSKEEKNEK